jgi:hypothetical protein
MKYIHNEVWGATIRIEYSHLSQDEAGFGEASANGISNVVFANEEPSSEFEDKLNSHPNHLKLMLSSFVDWRATGRRDHSSFVFVKVRFILGLRSS